MFPRAWYAVKAFTASAAMRIALDEGLDLLAATGGEVEACLRAGAPAGRVALHGNAKTDEELSSALEAGIGLVVADGLEELRRIDRLARDRGRVQPVFLRVAPDVEVATHEAIATGHDTSKFGTSLADSPMPRPWPTRRPRCEAFVSTGSTRTSGHSCSTSTRTCGRWTCSSRSSTRSGVGRG
jgi:diaminopimelate decarboxylase